MNSSITCIRVTGKCARIHQATELTNIAWVLHH